MFFCSSIQPTMASVLLRNATRLCTTVPSIGNSHMLLTSAKNILSTSSLSFSRTVFTARCFRCHQVVKNSKTLRASKLLNNLRSSIARISTRNVTTAAAENGGRFGSVAEAAAAETGNAAAWTHASGKPISARAQKIVGYWLVGCAGACFAQVKTTMENF